MHKVSEAFCWETTSKLIMYLKIPGFWDIDNKLVDAGYTPPIDLISTPIPTGDTKSITGQTLHPEKYGERTPASMKFHSRTEMPINAIIQHGELAYKVVHRGDYHTGGYWECLGKSLEEFTYDPLKSKLIYTEEGDSMVTENDVLLISEGLVADIFIKVGQRETSVKQLLHVKSLRSR